MEIDKVVVVLISFLFFRRREARVAHTLVQLYGSPYYFFIKTFSKIFKNFTKFSKSISNKIFKANFRE